jgi:hypothetical protein
MLFFNHTTSAVARQDSSSSKEQNGRGRGFPIVGLVLASAMVHGSIARATPATPEPTDEPPSSVQYQQGISGTHDDKWRAPIISVQTQKTSEGVKLIIDASVSNEEFRQYPIRFDFFVNRQLRSSQIRSVELPGDVGYLVPPEVAVPPFNYSVTATLLHPNRQYTSLAQGAVFPTDDTPAPDISPVLPLLTDTPTDSSSESGDLSVTATPTPDFEIDPTLSVDEDSDDNSSSESAFAIIKRILGPLPWETPSEE